MVPQLQAGNNSSLPRSSLLGDTGDDIDRDPTQMLLEVPRLMDSSRNANNCSQKIKLNGTISSDIDRSPSNKSKGRSEASVNNFTRNIDNDAKALSYDEVQVKQIIDAHNLNENRPIAPKG